jgi:hypothetical protein
MKFVIAAIIIIGLSLGAWQFYHYWQTFHPETAPAAAPGRPEITGEELSGLPPNLHGELQTAEEHGAATLKAFLTAHGKQIQDPRLAWIELDYVMLAGESDPVEARRVFARVKRRIDATSPAYHRMKTLEKTYEQK